MYTTVQSYGIGKIFYAFERRLSSMLNLFDKKYSKNSNIVKWLKIVKIWTI